MVCRLYLCSMCAVQSTDATWHLRVHEPSRSCRITACQGIRTMRVTWLITKPSFITGSQEKCDGRLALATTCYFLAADDFSAAKN